MEKVMVVEANYGSPVTVVRLSRTDCGLVPCGLTIIPVGARHEFSIPIDGKTLFEFEDDGHADIYIREHA